MLRYECMCTGSALVLTPTMTHEDFEEIHLVPEGQAARWSTSM